MANKKKVTKKYVTNNQIAKMLKKKVKPLKLTAKVLKEKDVFIICNKKGDWNIRDVYTEQEVRDIKLYDDDFIVKQSFGGMKCIPF